ncbi:NfeD family protein [Alkaliphilus peptidifermentans]|uniref:Membrane-bound serine protease (ClpP class) n=1 Tax=Alkaliphilus peptidifermentans DSM 18978 TaxID=1120976 RepID=A0A1G5BVQ2_9FIRM|nr:NfeD family protein [Alkaliphilus peptidifermentans]SCX94127.1 membrane-bound serine protease (ClpP class) [Alkaliphilus peptidifermentans DSM 18978]
MIKRIFTFMMLFLILMSFQAFGSQDEGIVYVIPIKGEIGPAVHQFIQTSINQAERDPRTTAIILEIDTYGGLIDSAVNISDLIVGSKHKTISLVNTKAESAGVLLAISADNIVMAPGSTIGSAEPVPNTEKTLSYWTSQLRTIAQDKGRDDQLVAAMADSTIVIPGIVEKGRLLNLTTQEAMELNFTDLVSGNYEEILEHFGIEYSRINEINIPGRVKLAQIFSSSYVAPFLLSIGFIGLLIELLTPGFGVGGTIGLVAFSLYFGSSILAGHAGWAVIIVFIAGLALLTIEAFAPGFGIAGVGGIICIVASIIMSTNSIITAVVSLLISFILTLVAFVLILKYAPKNRHFDRIILATTEKPDLGYTSTGARYSKYIGAEGIVKTYLRPSGSIEVDDELLDVVSEGDFIEIGRRVRIVRVEGRRIIVRKID